VKQIVYVLIGVFLFIVTIVVKLNYYGYKKIIENKCSVIDSTDLIQIKSLIEHSSTDTLYAMQKISIDYSRNGFYLVDKKNEWELDYSRKYFDIKIQYYDSSFIVLYCPVSGIMNGYMLFPINHNNLYVIDRKSGKEILNVQSVKGIDASIIKNNILYFKCYEPEVIRYIKL